MTETNQYIQVVEEQTEQLSVHPLSRVVGGWSELGGQDQEYDRKFVSKPRVETTERVSQGTVVSQWTKMPGDKDRVRVAHSKVIRPRVGQQEQGDMLSMSILPPAGDISATLLYSSMGMVWRDVGSQVTPNRVNGLPTDREEEQRQVDRIKQFLGCGGVLDRSCSGCGKVSRQRNLVMAGFSLLSVPDLLHPSIISACGMMVEGDRTQVYQLDPGYGQVALSGTAEMALGEYLAGKTLTREQLPGVDVRRVQVLQGGDWEDGGGEGSVQGPSVHQGGDVLRECRAGGGEQHNFGHCPPTGEGALHQAGAVLQGAGHVC